VMLTDDKHVKLIDFGTAVICDANGATPSEDIQHAGNASAGRAATFCGTTQYMSPELLGESYTCVASDYWAVGCILFHMLAGRRPYEAPTQYLLIKSILDDAVQYPADMDPLARDLISKLLVKNPAERLGADEKGGFAAVRKHPFFQNTKWDTLWTTNVAPLWQRDMRWIKDSDVSCCRKCGRDFNLIRRKHHCRNCGHIFCDACSAKLAHIPESSYSERQRVCDPCYDRILRV
jgi:serine/threonine protein kinase